MSKKYMFILYLCILLFTTLLFEIAEVNGCSMSPYLTKGQRVIVFKTPRFVIFNMRKNPIPFKIKRNHIYLFGHTDNLTLKSTLLIKRCVGIPGDSIIFNRLMVRSIHNIKEDFYSIDDHVNYNDNLDSDTVYIAPGQGGFFFIGDNLECSYDSRNTGLVSKNSIYGKVVYRMNLNIFKKTDSNEK